jgi:hypothetical protein
MKPGRCRVAGLCGAILTIWQFLPQSSSNTFLLSSATEGTAYWSDELNNTVFGHFLNEALSPTADLNGDGRIMVSEIRRFVESQYSAYIAKQMTRGLRQPVAAYTRDFPLVGSDAPFSRVFSLSIRIWDYDDGFGHVEQGNTAGFFGVLSSKLQALSLTPQTPSSPWNRAKVLEVLGKAESQVGPNDLLVIYYCGRARVAEDGSAQWVLYSPGGNDALTASELSAFLLRCKAKYKAVFMNVEWGPFNRRP